MWAMTPAQANATRLDPAEVAAAVEARELLRLLGMPRNRPLEGELYDRAETARAWYAAHGRPWVAVRRLEVQDTTAGVRTADGAVLRSARLAESLRRAHGHAVLVLAVSAGREVAAEIARAWADDRPDEAYFLDRFAAAVAEALVLKVSGDECRAFSARGETLLPPHSPGCSDFAIADQHRLMALLGGEPAGPERVALGPIELLGSGALDPPHSLLAACGMTREPLASTTRQALCRGCALEPCPYRRSPFRESESAVAADRRVSA
jgi:hypothetical protein